VTKKVYIERPAPPPPPPPAPVAQPAPPPKPDPYRLALEAAWAQAVPANWQVAGYSQPPAAPGSPAQRVSLTPGLGITPQQDDTLTVFVPDMELSKTGNGAGNTHAPAGHTTTGGNASLTGPSSLPSSPGQAVAPDGLVPVGSNRGAPNVSAPDAPGASPRLEPGMGTTGEQAPTVQAGDIPNASDQPGGIPGQPGQAGQTPANPANGGAATVNGTNSPTANGLPTAGTASPSATAGSGRSPASATNSNGVSAGADSANSSTANSNLAVPDLSKMDEAASPEHILDAKKMEIEGDYEGPRRTSSLPVDNSRILTADRYIPVQLETGINSQVGGEDTGTVVVQTTRDVFGYHSRLALLPKGSRLICNYMPPEDMGSSRLAMQCERVLIAGHRAEIRNIKSLVANAQGQLGASGEVDRRFMERYGNAFLLTGISTAVRYAAASTKSESNDGQVATAASEKAAEELSNKFGEITANILEETLSLKPIITIPQGTRFQIRPSMDWYIAKVE
ncbi:TrbI/VirB10 family protein, partial [Thalassospira profundimaris]|uniref:TrbI/VirB10 family protein n=1 Tax=Thalassospira profundimaris TaxID=502049 RepID=UPI00215D8623